MSSTPNYGFESNIAYTNSDAAIDRELKRVENKVDQNATSLLTRVDKVEGHGLISSEKLEQITVNQENIHCLSGRIDRANADISDRYTKSEVDAKLDTKACKCDLELHKMDPRAHQDLFDGKVDKQDGFGLISDQSNAQIESNKGDIAVINNKISAMYTQEEVDKLLANKVDAGAPTKYSLPFGVSFTTGPYYAYYFKDKFNIVHVYGTAVKSSAIALYDVIATLPIGFRPNNIIEIPALYTSPNLAASIQVKPDGTIIPTMSLSGQTKVFFNITFLAAQ